MLTGATRSFIFQQPAYCASRQQSDFLSKENAAQHCRLSGRVSPDLALLLYVRAAVYAFAQSVCVSIFSSECDCDTVTRANDIAEHAVHMFQRELELDAATMLTDSALTGLSPSRCHNWRATLTHWSPPLQPVAPAAPPRRHGRLFHVERQARRCK